MKRSGILVLIGALALVVAIVLAVYITQGKKISASGRGLLGIARQQTLGQPSAGKQALCQCQCGQQRGG